MDGCCNKKERKKCLKKLCLVSVVLMNRLNNYKGYVIKEEE